MKQRICALDGLKVLTMFLIIRSHADPLFPERLRFLASGGGWAMRCSF